MGYIGQAPSAVPISGSDISDGTIEASDLSSTLNLSSKTVTLPASSVTSHVTSFDDSDIRSDILKLALSQAVDGNRVAFNLEDSFVDGFEDSSGLTTLTDVTRNPAGEYVHSHTPESIAVTAHGDAQHSTTYYKIGASSIYLDGTGDKLTIAANNDFDFGTNNWTYECWCYLNNNASGEFATLGHPAWRVFYSSSKIKFVGGGIDTWLESGNSISASSWTHIAVVRNGTSVTFYNNGVARDNPQTTSSSMGSSSNTLTMGHGDNYINGYLDEIRISDIARYTGNFTPPTAAFGNDANTVLKISSDTSNGSTTFSGSGSPVITATGTLISDPQTASTSRTSCSGVIIYEDGAGTNTLGGGSGDLRIYFTANSGTNWTEAASYGTATTYSGTKKLVKLGATTVTAGTQVAMKAVWANQSASKEARLHGWAVNY